MSCCTLLLQLCERAIALCAPPCPTDSLTWQENTCSSTARAASQPGALQSIMLPSRAAELVAAAAVAAVVVAVAVAAPAKEGQL